MIAGCLLVAGCAQAPPTPQIKLLPPDLVLVARVGSAEIPPRAAGCSLQTLEQTPSAIFRDLGSIELAGSVPAGKDVLMAVDQKACETGADAILVKQREERLTGDHVDYHIIAEALLLRKPKAAPSPAAESSATDDESSPNPSPSDEEAGTSASEVAPPEALMQPVAPDEPSRAAAGSPAGAATSMTESPIAPTEAAPLSQSAPGIAAAPALSPSLTAIATSTESPQATPSATPSPAPLEATPTPSATPTPLSESPTPQPSATATPSSPPTPSPSLTATATSSETPTITSSTTPSTSASPTVAPTD
jgi:hypothetical protein